MPLLPDPLSIGLLKTACYGGYGWFMRRQGAVGPPSIVFGLARVAAGWIVGVPFFLILLGKEPHLSGFSILALFSPLRWTAWAIVIRYLRRPRGGWRSIAAYASLGTILSCAVDFVVLDLLGTSKWFTTPFC